MEIVFTILVVLAIIYMCYIWHSVGKWDERLRIIQHMPDVDCNKHSHDYNQGFLDACLEMIDILDNKKK